VTTTVSYLAESFNGIVVGASLEVRDVFSIFQRFRMAAEHCAAITATFCSFTVTRSYRVAFLMPATRVGFLQLISTVSFVLFTYNKHIDDLNGFAITDIVIGDRSRAPDACGCGARSQR
jgi:hypothetical protein